MIKPEIRKFHNDKVSAQKLASLIAKSDIARDERKPPQPPIWPLTRSGSSNSTAQVAECNNTQQATGTHTQLNTVRIVNESRLNKQQEQGG